MPKPGTPSPPVTSFWACCWRSGSPPPASLSRCHSLLFPARLLQPANPRGPVYAASESWQISEEKKKTHKNHPRKREWQVDTALSPWKRALRLTRAWTPVPRAQSQLRLHLSRFTGLPLHAGGPDASVYTPSSQPSARRQRDRAASRHWTSSVSAILSFSVSFPPPWLSPRTPSNDQKGCLSFETLIP